ncbi:MAG: Putative pyruvate, phosphate dikinase regulatory protein [SAR116 cluster bacterium MED-G04]|nr:phosphoenolpyruvate synthase regulatory protein [SAR116 cluster bacterium]OUW37299.1 MAG: phosphoenolpyruvate synthase regulatory protein [Gammaproteobacteria bacterium TMED183]CAI8447935.1 MAG: Putative pyruvate, phosphate dikinase regulatory protein [SAR116 cluster bacterium MED-G04]|tara:strand:+ start:3872 stop:4708 length:837 start_codon:yes stop_codon:yes gene_type:complete
MKKEQQTLHLHLVSDATGETTHQLARAALARFSNVRVIEHVWTLVRTEDHLASVHKAIETHGGVVFFSIAERELRSKLEDLCRMHNIPALSVLDHVIHTLSKVLGQPDEEIRGGQHRMDEAYFDRIEALDFTIQHDDGQGLSTVGNADILIVGVSRSSKTPTSIYLAHRGYKVANYPLVPGVPMPLDEMPMGGLFTVGLIKDARRLVQIRRNRLLAMNERENSSYADMKTISDEINNARKLFTSQNWPVIDVSRRSVEETAAEIINLYNTWLENEGAS